MKKLKQAKAQLIRQLKKLPRPKLHKTGLIVVASVSVLAGLGTTLAVVKLRNKAPEKVENPEPLFVIPEEAYANLEKQEDGEECNGLYKLNNVPGEDVRCSYGPEVSFVYSTWVQGGNTTPGPGVQCIGDNMSGMRVQGIYAYAEDQTDRYDELVSRFRTIADHVSNSVAVSAEKTGGTAQLKWVTDANCDIKVEKVKMRATEDDSFSETISAVMREGHDEPGKLYLIWTDANLVCGIADFISDTDPDPNVNYSSNGMISRYNRIDRSCWGQSELHEILHNMGAVQHTAPHATGRGHCYDGYESMCYGDGGRAGQSSGCNISHAYLLDCNNDDYFHANPEPGSYLANHWNLFNSNYLLTSKSRVPDPSDTTPPPKPYDVVTYDVVQDGFKIRWKLPSTEDIVKIQVEVDGKVKVTLNSPQTSTYSFGLKPARTYTARVVTVDQNGNSSRSDPVTFTTLATPPVSEGSIIPRNLKVQSINGAHVTLTAVIDRIPKEDVRYIIRRSNGVGSNSYQFASTNTPQTYTFADRYVYPQYIVSYHIRVLRPDGSEIGRTEEIPFNFTGSFESNPPPSPTGFTLKPYLGMAGHYIEYNQMVDDSGMVHHYSYNVTGPNGYSYNLDQTYNVLSPPNLVSGSTYTVTARVYDIWSNASAPAVNSFVYP